MPEAVQLSARANLLNHGITLLMSSMAGADRADGPQSERQITSFNDLRRLYHGIRASLAGASAILLNPKSHFDLVRADEPLFGINPVPGSANPMLPVVELRARIVQVRDTTPEARDQSGVAWRSSRSAAPTAFRVHGIRRPSFTPPSAGTAVP